MNYVLFALLVVVQVPAYLWAKVRGKDYTWKGGAQ